MFSREQVCVLGEDIFHLWELLSQISALVFVTIPSVRKADLAEKATACKHCLIQDAGGSVALPPIKGVSSTIHFP
jgi:hypothetical protein